MVIEVPPEFINARRITMFTRSNRLIWFVGRARYVDFFTLFPCFVEVFIVDFIMLICPDIAAILHVLLFCNFALDINIYFW